MNYISNSTNLDGVRAEEIKQALNKEVQDELSHAQMLAKRIKEKSGKVPGSKDFNVRQSYLQPSDDTTDVVHVIKGVIDAENDAAEGYKEVIRAAQADEDYVTEDMAITLLADEESHRTIFEGI